MGLPMTDRRPFFLGLASLDASLVFVRGGAQFLNLSGGRIGKIKLAHRFQFINDD